MVNISVQKLQQRANEFGEKIINIASKHKGDYESLHKKLKNDLKLRLLGEGRFRKAWTPYNSGLAIKFEVSTENNHKENQLWEETKHEILLPVLFHSKVEDFYMSFNIQPKAHLLGEEEFMSNIMNLYEDDLCVYENKTTARNAVDGKDTNKVLAAIYLGVKDLAYFNWARWKKNYYLIDYGDQDKEFRKYCLKIERERNETQNN